MQGKTPRRPPRRDEHRGKTMAVSAPGAFLSFLHLSLAPGFSRVLWRERNRAAVLTALARGQPRWQPRKPLKRLSRFLAPNTRLKPGANEMGIQPQEIEMRPRRSGCDPATNNHPANAWSSRYFNPAKPSRAARILPWHRRPAPPATKASLPIPLPQILLPNSALLASGSVPRHQPNHTCPPAPAARRSGAGRWQFPSRPPPPRAATGDRSRSASVAAPPACAHRLSAVHHPRLD